MPTVAVVTAKARIPVRQKALEDRLEGRIYRALLVLFNGVAASVKLNALEEVILQNPAAVERFLDVETKLQSTAQGAGLVVEQESLAEVLQFAFNQGATAALQELGKVPVVKAANTIGAAMAFNLNNAEALTFLESYTFNLITGISAESRRAIGDVILEAFKEGGHPYEQAKLIRNSIGLTQQQARAVLNYRKALQSGNPAQLRQTLDKVLRDGRYDKSVLNAIKAGTKLPKEKINAMVARYQERLLMHRARTIARTETIRANSWGQLETWNQAEAQGFLDRNKTRRVWQVATDERTCLICKEIPGMNPNGVALHQPFATSIGSILFPPAHVSCRCSVGIKLI